MITIAGNIVNRIPEINKAIPQVGIQFGIVKLEEFGFL